MDDQSRSDILGKSSDPSGQLAARIASIPLLLLLAGCPGPPAEAPPDLPAVGGHASLIRVPRDGGIVEAYDADSFAEPTWTSRVPVPHIREVLGVSLEAKLLIAVDTNKTLVGVDLESRGLRAQTADVEAAVMAPDGGVYVLASTRRITRVGAGIPVPYRTVLPVPPIFHAGTLGERYVALLGTKPRTLVVINPERQVGSTDVVDGPATSTLWGDLVAVVAPNRVVIYDTEEPFGSRSLEVDRTPTGVTFSPSGHRIYVADETRSIAVFDRFGLDKLSEIELPGVPARFRTDGSGRWMVARPADGDSVWVVDLSTNRYVATAPSEWADDLPTVAGAASLLVRGQGDLIALDVGHGTPKEIGRVPGGGADIWVVTTWVPRDRLDQINVRAESLLVAQDSLLVADSLTTGGAEANRLYLQVSSSQNQDWSKELIKQLIAGGYPARVLEPTTSDDGYRVVVGPYATREAADEAGRKLGRPFFVLINPPIRN